MKHLQQRECVQYVKIQPISFEHNPLSVTGTDWFSERLQNVTQAIRLMEKVCKGQRRLTTDCPKSVTQLFRILQNHH